jgi:small-conductance mechanosensitive channel
VVVLHALRKAGIEIPYPQRVVQLRSDPAAAPAAFATENNPLQK